MERDDRSLLARITEVISLARGKLGRSKDELGALLEIWRERRDGDPDWYGSSDAHRMLAQRFLDLGAAPLAKEVARNALEYEKIDSDQKTHRPWAQDEELCLTYGFSLARTANPEQAQQVLGELRDRLKMDQDRLLDDAEKHIWEETLGMLARTYKDQSELAADKALKQELRNKALHHYERAFRLTGGYWTGINVATLARLNNDESRALEVAREVQGQCLDVLPNVSPGHRDRYWVLATLGEAALVLRNLGEAKQYYLEAYQAGPKSFGNLNATRRHARWLLEHWRQDVTQLDAWLPIPQVVVFAGHMIDRRDRSTERFPARLAGAVKAAIKEWLQSKNALIGFSSAACGADILFQEALRELGGECRIILPYHEQEFLEDSVDIIPGADWNDRFQDVVQHASEVVRVSTTRLRYGSVAYDFANQILHGLAVRRADELETRLLGLAVWNGNPGDGLGGTASAVMHWHEHRHRVFRVDLSQLPSDDYARISVTDEWPVAKPSSLSGVTGEATTLSKPLDCRVAALLFADAVGFSKLPELATSRRTGTFRNW